MSTPPSSHSVAQNYVDPTSLPVRRKRGRPRKDEVLVSEPTSRTQRQRANSPASSGQGLVGQAVSGILDGAFEAGYLLTVRVGTAGPVFKGILFDPRISPPISAENDIAPNLPMVNQNDFVVAEASSRASDRRSNQHVHQNARAVQPLPRHEPVPVPTPTQPVQQSARAAQPVQRNEPAAVHAPTHVGAVQSFERTEYTTIPIPAVLVPQNVIAVRPLQRNEPTAVTTPALLPIIQPVQRNEPSAVHTPAQLLEQNVKAVQPLLRDDSAAVSIQAQPVPPNAKQAAQNDAGGVLKSDSGHQDPQISATVAASIVDPGASATHEILQSEVKNEQTATSEGPPAAVVKEEEALVVVPVTDNQSGEGVEVPDESDANPQQIGVSAKILNATETNSVLPGCMSRMAEHQALVTECKSEVWTGQLVTGTPGALESQVCGTTSPEFTKPAALNDDSA